MDFPDTRLKRSRNMTPSIDEVFDACIGSSSRFNRETYNDLPEDSYNPSNQIAEETGEINGDNGFGNSSTDNNNTDGGDSDENTEEHIPSKTNKSYKRHNKRQLHGLETLFEKNPHPNEGQRKELGHELHLNPEQVKFWFQNKRTHVKAQFEKYTTTVLRDEKEMLIAENISLKEEHSNKQDLCQLCIGTMNQGELSEVRQLILSNFVFKHQITCMQEKIATFEDEEPLFDSSVVLPLLTHPVQNHFQHPILGEINGLVNPLEPIQGPADTANPLEPIHGPVNPSEPIHGPVNPSEPIHGLVNPIEPMHRPADPPEFNHGPFNPFEPNHVPVGPLEPTHGPVNPFGPIHGPVNPFEPIHGNANPLEPVNALVNPLEPVHELVNLPDPMYEPVHEPVNLPGPIYESVHEPVNLPGTMYEPVNSNPVYAHINPFESIQVTTNVDNKKMMKDLALSALREFVIMAEMNSSLWLLKNTNPLVLNEEEYSRLISKETPTRPMGFKREASKETTVVKMSSNDLVKIFMDEKKWSTVFSDIVAKVTNLEVLSSGEQESYHNALHLMNAEFQVLSPLIPTREICFARYCSNNCDGSWTVVDISLDNSWQSNYLSLKYRRKPSGCLIEDLPGGYSKVTWVEHVEVDYQDVPDSHLLYLQFIDSGLAFGAKRWISILKRHYRHLTRFLRPTLADIPNTVMPCTKGTRSMLMLAKRMVVSFHKGASSSIAKGWTYLLPGSGHSHIHLMVRKNIDDPGHPFGTVLSASSSFWLPIVHERVFGYLRNSRFRHEWDVLLEGRAIEEIANIPISGEEWNCLSLKRVFVPSEKRNKMLILQESHSDENGSFITYALFKNEVINAVLEGWEDPAQMALLPCGFAIFPDALVTSPTESRGCLVTISFQMLLDLNPYAEISDNLVTNASNVIASTIARITESLKCKKK